MENETLEKLNGSFQKLTPFLILETGHLENSSTLESMIETILSIIHMDQIITYRLLRGCRGSGDSHGDSHSHPMGMGMGMKFSPVGIPIEIPMGIPVTDFIGFTFTTQSDDPS